MCPGDVKLTGCSTVGQDEGAVHISNRGDPYCSGSMNAYCYQYVPTDW